MRELVLLLLVAVSAISCSNTNTTGKASVTIYVADSASRYASLTGKFSFWRFNEFYKVDEDGTICFSKQITSPELLHIKINKSYNSLSCYMEKGDSIQINYNDHHYQILGTSPAALQNRLLQEIQEIRKGKPRNPENVQAENSPPNERSSHVRVEQIISNFILANPDCSPDFVKYLRLDNKYDKILNSLNKPTLAAKTYVAFTDVRRAMLAEAALDSHEHVALLSGSYRTVLFAWLDQLRISDAPKTPGKGNAFILNELRLACYLNSPEIKNYMVAKNVMELLPHLYSDPQIKSWIEVNCHEWAGLLLPELEELAASEPNSEINLPGDVNISGIGKEGRTFELNDLKGKLGLVYFWSVKNAVSEYEWFYLKQIRALFPESKIEILGVSVDEPGLFEEWKQKLSDEPMVGHQIFCPENGTLINQLGIGRLPHFCMVSPNGEMPYNNIPKPSSGMSHQLIAELVAQVKKAGV